MPMPGYVGNQSVTPVLYLEASLFGGHAHMTIALSLLLAATMPQTASARPDEAELRQPDIDARAQKYAATTTERFLQGRWEPLTSTQKPMDPRRHPWRPLTDAYIRATQGYWAPEGYVYRKSAQADLDRDGRSDTVELVENGKQGAIRIRYGAPGKAARIVSCGDQQWSGEALFPAGRHAVMVNYPESRVYFLFQKNDAVRAIFVGD